MNFKKRYELQVCGSLCELRYLRIDGQNADYEDFVDKYDHDEKNADEYCCGDMRCDIKEPAKEVLEKYCINEAEFYEIAHVIADKLDFGCCGLCC